MRAIQFTGDYKALKPMGFTFQKLYAHNYMQWSYDFGEEYGDCIRIWKTQPSFTFDGFTALQISQILAPLVNSESSALKWIIKARTPKTVDGKLTIVETTELELSVFMNSETGEVIPYQEFFERKGKLIEQYKESMDSDEAYFLASDEMRVWHHKALNHKQLKFIGSMVKQNMLKVIEVEKKDNG